MLAITQGMNRVSLNSLEQLTFDRFDKDGDGVISFAEFTNFISTTNVGKVNRVEKREHRENKGFDVEQFDPQGSINFERNGGHNAKKLNILA